MPKCLRKKYCSVDDYLVECGSYFPLDDIDVTVGFLTLFVAGLHRFFHKLYEVVDPGHRVLQLDSVGGDHVSEGAAVVQLMLEGETRCTHGDVTGLTE